MPSSVSKDSNSGLLAYLADQILAWLQERCRHPGTMVAVDILEGSAESSGIKVSYCRRCGAVRVEQIPVQPYFQGRRYVQFPNTWRSPNPNLWRGK